MTAATAATKDIKYAAQILDAIEYRREASGDPHMLEGLERLVVRAHLESIGDEWVMHWNRNDPADPTPPGY